MGKRKRLVEDAEFKVDRGKCLIICLFSNLGLDRIIIENKKGVIHVRATGHSRFEFSDEKREPGACDFWLGNPSASATLENYLIVKFWGQFNWSELFDYQEDTKFKRAIKKKIKKLVDEFEEKAAKQLNGIVKKMKKKKKKKR